MSIWNTINADRRWLPELNCFPLPASFVADVTQEDIRAGQAEDCAMCPIALASLRALDLPALAFEVFGTAARAGNTLFNPSGFAGLAPKGNVIYHCIDNAGENFVSRYDDGKAVKPQQILYKIHPAKTYSQCVKENNRSMVR